MGVQKRQKRKCRLKFASFLMETQMNSYPMDKMRSEKFIETVMIALTYSFIIGFLFAQEVSWIVVILMADGQMDYREQAGCLGANLVKYDFIEFQLKQYYFILTMGKQPVQGQKKSKDSIAKAAAQSKGPAKKWNKGKVKEKADHAVFLDRATYDRLITGIPKLGKHITVSGVIQKFKVVGSIARQLIKRCVENGSLRSAQSHSKQALYSPVAVVETKVVETKQTKAKQPKGQAKKKEK